jgi:hypothetical protein
MLKVEPSARRRRMPTGDWESGFVCWHCAQSSLVTGGIVMERPPQRGSTGNRHPDISFFRVVLECGQPGCLSRMEVLVSNRRVLSLAEAGEEAVRGAHSYHCLKSHKMGRDAYVRAAE